MSHANKSGGSLTEFLTNKSGEPSVGGRLTVLDSLRGLAALSVCFFHFAGRDDLLPGTYLQEVSRFGYLGVIAFFVISGFVIPWSLHHSGYRLGDFPRFLLKRLLRLELPYLVAVASVVAFVAFYSWSKKLAFPPVEQWWLQVALHVGYLTRFFGFDWLSDVYWTLAIEFQFYLLIGLAFPLLSHRRAGVRWAACAVLTALSFSALALPEKMFVITCLPPFVLGILGYQRRTGLIGLSQFLGAVALVGAVCYWTSNGAIALTAVATIIMITSIDDGWKPLNWRPLKRLGLISYSLYLFHATLGGAIIGLGIKHTSSPLARYLVLFAALAAVLAVAVAMYWLVERPSRRWSSSIHYAPRRRQRTCEESTTLCLKTENLQGVAGVGALRNPGVCSSGASLRSSPGHPRLGFQTKLGMIVLPYFVRWCLGLAHAETQTTKAERDCIARRAAGRRRLAEIGVWHGVTTSLIRQRMSADGVLLAIDPFRPGRLGFSTQRIIARRSVAKHRRGRVVWLRTTGAHAATEPAARELNGIDFVFIDGDHSYDGLRCDWEAWSPLISPGGCVALHDSRSTPNNNIDDAGSVLFTRDVILNDPHFEVVDLVDSLTVVRRLETSV